MKSMTRKRMSFMLLAVMLVCAVIPTGIGAAPAKQTGNTDEIGIRAQQLIDQVSTRTSYPWTSDLQKFLWPIVLAKLAKNSQDAQALEWARNGNYGTSADAVKWGKANLLFRDEFWHFAGMGLVRIMHQFPHVYDAPYGNSGKTIKRDILEKAMPDLWLNDIPNGGTENHLIMMYSTDYLLMQEAVKEELPGAEERLDAAKDWIKGYAARLYANGQGEWDSSNYLTFDASGFLNILDFAEDPEAKAAAKAVLDWYAASYALKYTNGVYSGAELRGAAAFASSASIADMMGYVWFGDAPVPSFTSNNSLYSVYASLSHYRPHEAIISIARKSATAPYMAYNSKPDYWMEHKSVSRETFYSGKSYSLGAIYDPIGGWGGGTYREYPWKLVARGTDGAYVMSGNSAGNGTGDNGRNPFTQLAHHKNVLIQMTVVPERHESIINEVSGIYSAWKEREKALRAQYCAEGKSPNFCVTPDPVNMTGFKFALPEAYVSFPANTIQVLQAGGTTFFHFGHTYVAAHAIYGALTSPSAPKKGRSFVKDIAVVGKPGGFVIEAGAATDFVSFQDFIAKIQANSKLDRSGLDELTVRYTSLDGDEITMTFNTSGAYSEPQFDWGDVPEFPQGEGSGRVADIWVNDRKLDLDSAWDVYSSPYVQVKGNALHVSDGQSGFRTFINPDNKIITTPNNGQGQIKSWNDNAFYK